MAKVIGNYSFVWELRQQPPAGNGTADISTVHVAVGGKVICMPPFLFVLITTNGMYRAA
jgi:hypothetical protein